MSIWSRLNFNAGLLIAFVFIFYLNVIYIVESKNNQENYLDDVLKKCFFLKQTKKKKILTSSACPAVVIQCQGPEEPI